MPSYEIMRHFPPFGFSFPHAAITAAKMLCCTATNYLMSFMTFGNYTAAI